MLAQLQMADTVVLLAKYFLQISIPHDHKEHNYANIASVFILKNQVIF